MFDAFFSVAWYIVPIFVFSLVIRTAWFKGVMGEWLVNIFIKLCLDKNDYHLIKNVTLPTEDGTTQIDHIIVSKFGIFVVETKNMKGWIFGTEKQKQWTQKIFKHTAKFQNPLHQNYKHVKTLEGLLLTESNVKSSTIFSVIIFIGDSTFKTKMPENVTYARGGIEYIKSKRDNVFSEAEVFNIIAKVEEGRFERSLKTNRQHVKHVREIANEKVETNSCSRCNSPMVLRKTTRGKNAGNEFWGCSAFPKCKNVANLES